MLELKKIVKLHNQQTSLDHVDLTINRGDIISIIGPSGGGKSTLLRCINFLSPPDTGEIIYNNEVITNKNANYIRKNIGMVFQNFNLFPHLTILENIIYAPMHVLNIDRKTAEKSARSLLKQVGLLNKAKNYPHNLSGGQKQRVAIARSLAMQPEIILFDEPTSALDPEMTNEVLNVIRNFVDTGVTMVLVTHQIDFALELATKIIFLDKGKILEQVTKEQVMAKKTKYIKDFMKKTYK